MSREQKIKNTVHILSQISKLQEKVIKTFPFKEGQRVQFIDKDTKEVKIGRIDFINLDSKEDFCVSVQLNSTDNIGWSNNTKYFELEATEYRQSIKDLKLYRGKECVHKWEEAYPTGRIVKHLIGETEEKIMYCINCEQEGRNV